MFPGHRLKHMGRKESTMDGSHPTKKLHLKHNINIDQLFLEISKNEMRIKDDIRINS